MFPGRSSLFAGKPTPTSTPWQLIQRDTCGSGFTREESTAIVQSIDFPEDLFMPVIPSTTAYVLAPVAGVVVRGSQQPAMISHYPPPVSGVVGGVAAPPRAVVVLG
ncbi:hypothetical protein HU772_017985 [Pseudomonas xantholysinigenes]|uniref:Uncharacterized protein n=2 Tax=Pseudomonas xantholysinigenes TaxID=2745490 RepID=A0A9E6Q1R6_9PSED|nr:hypothetical protein HU772_017985 [Pseudomonas xantholysinigenes]